jgi:hypothetical protein
MVSTKRITLKDAFVVALSTMLSIKYASLVKGFFLSFQYILPNECPEFSSSH